MQSAFGTPIEPGYLYSFKGLGAPDQKENCVEHAD
jgi:hypothetical protein